LRAQRHAKADFARAIRNQKRKNAVDANAAQGERKNGKDDE